MGTLCGGRLGAMCWARIGSVIGRPWSQKITVVVGSPNLLPTQDPVGLGFLRYDFHWDS